MTSGQYLNIHIDREAIARYGIDVATVEDVIETAVGERVLTRTLEGRLRFPVRVRYAPAFRADATALGNVLVSTAAGPQIPLKQVARIESARGPAMIAAENGLLLATVLLNVQDRDVGGFVDEAKAAVAARVPMPVGYFADWSGRYENQARARQRLQVVVPIVLIVIFGLLYITYHSALEAAHVLLAVPFALTGGVYLLWFLGYNFSVAVWVGFIALFGTAVQTGVVMVIYLEESVRRKLAACGAAMTRGDLRDAIVEGALLRLRPKLMTVATVVAGLLPIMWSTRVGAEVMKPLATPVIGGMVSSLLHVLVVTPVLFFWIHERRLGLFASGAMPVSMAVSGGALTAAPARPSTRLRVVVVAILVATAAAGWWFIAHRSPGERPQASRTDIVQIIRSGDMSITLASRDGALHQGSNTVRLEFRSAATNALVDAGNVRLGGQMTMPGMVMPATLDVTPLRQVGTYEAHGEFGMAGTYQMTIAWDGPAGRGSAPFAGDVR